MGDADLVVVRTFMNRQEAELACGALDAAGIEALVRGDDAGGMYPGLWEGNGVQLLVRADDEPAAREVLAAP